jgi:hypothetical protein
VGSKPHASPASVATTTPPAAKAPVPKPAPTIRKPDDAGVNPLLIVLSVVLVALMTGGVAFTIWKINNAANVLPDHVDVDDQGKGQLAQNAKDGQGKDTVAQDNSDKANADKSNADKTGGSSKKPQAAADKKDKKDDDDDDIRPIQKKVDQKPKLERKPEGNGSGVEPKFDPIEVVPSPPAPAPVNVPGLTAKQIDDVIEKGVAYLKQNQSQDGTWNSSNHQLGYAALCGLTLLECNVPAGDRSVQRAAEYVRANAANQGSTYEMSCAILFLDRLGEPRDRALIQGMALRLMSGQNECGGWNYGTNSPSGEQMYQLFNFLHANKQPLLLNPLAGHAKTNLGRPVSPGRPAGDPFQQLSDLIATKGITPPPDARLNSAQEFGKPVHVDWLNPGLRKIPVVENQSRKKARVSMFRTDEADTDNSNTQFAILALWAARRHDVPVDYALLTAYRRFVATQGEDGGWGYARKNINGTSVSMTCAGLLGLAMGHGVSPEFTKFNPQSPKDSVVKPALQHLEIQRALKVLSQEIRQPVANPQAAKFTDPDLYLFWSIERVAMLYDLKKIDGKDWYGWGAQIVVQRQQPDGSWAGYTYPGSSPQINTCFALMFLRRTNLVQDLTHSLRLQSGIREKN